MILRLIIGFNGWNLYHHMYSDADVIPTKSEICSSIHTVVNDRCYGNRKLTRMMESSPDTFDLEFKDVRKDKIIKADLKIIKIA